MTRIFEEVETELAEAGHGISGWFRKPDALRGYHQHQQQRPEGDTMSILDSLGPDLAQLVQDARDKVAALDSGFKAFAEQKLPEVATLAQNAAGNPLVDAALSAKHLGPELLSSFAALITKADADIAALAPVPEPAAEPADPQVQTGIAQ